MFSIFNKNPVEKLKKQHRALLEQAMQAQRRGDIRSYSDLSNQAEVVLSKIDSLGDKK